MVQQCWSFPHSSLFAIGMKPQISEHCPSTPNPTPKTKPKPHHPACQIFFSAALLPDG